MPTVGRSGELLTTLEELDVMGEVDALRRGRRPGVAMCPVISATAAVLIHGWSAGLTVVRSATHDPATMNVFAEDRATPRMGRP